MAGRSKAKTLKSKARVKDAGKQGATVKGGRRLAADVNLRPSVTATAAARPVVARPR